MERLDDSPKVNPTKSKILSFYNELFSFLSDKVWVNGEIIELQRGVMFPDASSVFFDYLDKTHYSIKQEYNDPHVVGCIRLHLSSGTEIYFSTEHSRHIGDLPIHSFDNLFLRLTQTEAKAFEKVLHKLNSLEHDFFQKKSLYTTLQQDT